MSDFYGNLKMEKLSPAGLSMTHWVDSYINVLIKTVVDKMKVASGVKEDQLRGTTREKVSGDGDVARFVDTIITKSIAAVLFQEESFVNDLVLEVLDKASREIISEVNFELYEHNLKAFARKFADDVIRKAMENKRCTKKEVSGKKAHDKNTKDSSLFELTSTNIKNVESRQGSGKVAWKKGKTGLFKPKLHKKPVISSCHDNGKPGVDYMYVHNRLKAILGKGVDSSITRYVVNAVPEHGTWTEQFTAVEKKIRNIEAQQKCGYPLMTEFTVLPDIIPQGTKEVGAKDVNPTCAFVQKLLVPATSPKMAKITTSTRSRKRGILLRIRNALRNFRISFKT